MKKIKLIVMFLSVGSISLAQNNFVPQPGGSVYFGTPAAGPLEGVNLQVHGVYDLCSDIGGPKSQCPKASRFLMTNSNTGFHSTDGTLFTMNNFNFSIVNQEKKNIVINTNGLILKFDGLNKRLWLGNPIFYTDAKYAKFNVLSTGENGLYIKTKTANKYGLSIETRELTDNAIQVMGVNGTTRNFSVQANGFVFARKYTTTLANIPDYVFDTNYNLMPLSNLRTYINTNKHLPNIPSATEFEKTGVDLGELNRLLLEKTEELTLYILQLEKRLSKLETRE